MTAWLHAGLRFRLLWDGGARFLAGSPAEQITVRKLGLRYTQLEHDLKTQFKQHYKQLVHHYERQFKQSVQEEVQKQINEWLKDLHGID
jgi:hypothetical protein